MRFRIPISVPQTPHAWPGRPLQWLHGGASTWRWRHCRATKRQSTTRPRTSGCAQLPRTALPTCLATHLAPFPFCPACTACCRGMVEVGPQVRTIQKGDRVVVSFDIGCGERAGQQAGGACHAMASDTHALHAAAATRPRSLARLPRYQAAAPLPVPPQATASTATASSSPPVCAAVRR